MNVDLDRRKERLMKSLKHKMPRCFLVVGLALLLLLGVVGLVSRGGTTEQENEMLAFMFQNDLLAVEVNGLWGYTNSRGELEIEPVFEEAEWQFNGQGTAAVKIDGLWGFVDRQGQLVSEARYEEKPVRAFGNVYRLPQEGQSRIYFLVDHTGRILSESSFTELYTAGGTGYGVVMTDGKMGLMDANGRYVISPKYEDIIFYPEADVALVKIDGQYGLMNLKEKFLLEPCLLGAVRPENRLVQVYRAAEAVDSNGLIFVYLTYECSCGVDAPAYGAINTKGKIIFEAKSHQEIVYLEDIGLYSYYTGGQYCLSDAEGNFLPDAQYEIFQQTPTQGLRAAGAEGAVGYVDSELNYIIPPIFERAKSFAENGLAAVLVDGKWGYINTSGEMVIPPKFYTADTFKPWGLARVEVDGKFGVIDQYGNYVVEPSYSYIDPLESELIKAVAENTKERHIVLINNKGQVVFGPVDESSARVRALNKKYYSYRVEDTSYLIDAEGNITEHDSIMGLRWTDSDSLQQGRKYGIMDGSGTLVFPVEYDQVYGWIGEWAYARKDSTIYAVNHAGEIREMGVYDELVRLRNGGEYAFLAGYTRATLIDGQGNKIMTLPGLPDMSLILSAFYALFKI